MKPVIALVGRANVGKSTLFNRLTKTRDAIVADFAGLTRDRHYGDAKVGKHEFIVVDTGGLLLAAHVGPVHENDRVGGKMALQKLAQQGFERLGLVLADAGYDGQPLAQWTREYCGWRLETAPGLTGSGDFTPVPTRWVVERSIS